MGLLDVFKKDKNKDVAATIEEGAEVVQVLSEAYLDIKSLPTVQQISYKDINSFNDAFKQLAPAVMAIYEEANKKDSGLYKLTNLALEKGKSLDKATKPMAKQALKLSSGKMVMSCHPVVLVIAVVVISIEKEAVAIHDVCDKILAFLKFDKESQVEGDLATLNTITKEFKYNWDNKEYRQNHHKLALDIKRSAEQNCIFYQKQINNLILDKKKALVSKTLEEKQKAFENSFKYYQLSLYVYAYASLIEALLLGNYEDEYLNCVAEELELHSNNYHSLYNEVLEKLELTANTSAESKVLKGIGGLMQKAKKSEWISKTGKTIETAGNRQTLKSFEELENDPSIVFYNNIKQLSFLMDDKTEIYFNKDGIIFAQE